MNPSTGTFITMDEYAGSIFEPVSLHKYLYANANPVTYSDPTGYFSLSELNVTQAIEAQLHKMLVPNFKNIMNMINGMASWCDFCHQVGKMLSSGATLEDIIESIARGVISGALLNLMCQMEMLGPLLKAFLVGYGYYIQIDAFNKAVEEGDIISAVLIAIQLGTDLTALADSCFTGETLVAAEDGQKRIDEIKVGDKVWAYNVETGETELKKVTTVYVHEVEEILHLSTTEGDIDTTTNHPFYVIDKGWVAAGDLEEGDEVYNLDGSTAVIIDSELEKLDDSLLVYNLEIEDFHTYFVGYEPVLVHNSCSDSYHGNSSKSTKKQHGYEIIESDTGKVVKTGISGGDLNINGSSKRANSQVNNWNKAEGNGKYEANVVKTDMPDRATALQWEKNNAQRLYDEGQPMSKHKRPGKKY